MNFLRITLLLSYLCIASISAVIITPALPQVESYYHLTTKDLGWVISIFMIGYVIGQLLYGPLANHFGRLTALRIGLAINLIGIALCLISVTLINYPLILIGRFTTGLGAAAGLSCTFMLLNELLSKEQAKVAMSYTIVSFTLGIGLAVTFGGMITQFLHWQDCFWFLLIHGCLMMVLTWQFNETLTEPKPLNLMAIVTGYSNALKSSQLLVFSLCVGLASAIAYGYSTAAPLYAQSVLHLTPEKYGYWNSMNMIGMLASGFLSAYLIKKHGPKKLLMIGFGLLIPTIISLGLISITAHPDKFWFFVITMFLYLFSGLLFPAASFLASTAINDKASASSMMSFINMGSATLAVVIMGYIPMATILSFAVIIAVFLVVAMMLSSKSILQS